MDYLFHWLGALGLHRNVSLVCFVPHGHCPEASRGRLVDGVDSSGEPLDAVCRWQVFLVLFLALGVGRLQHCNRGRLLVADMASGLACPLGHLLDNSLGPYQP